MIWVFEVSSRFMGNFNYIRRLYIYMGHMYTCSHLLFKKKMRKELPLYKFSSLQVSIIVVFVIANVI